MSIAVCFFVDESIVGHIVVWNLANGDLMKHKVCHGAVLRMALSGEKIVAFDGSAIRVFSFSPSCLFETFEHFKI